MGQSIIEINGTRYDATTGQVIEPVAQIVRPASNIDGIVRGQNKIAPTVKLPSATPKSMANEHQAPRRFHDISTVQSARVLKSKTLVRCIVGKPGGRVTQSPHASVNPVAHSTSYSSSAKIGQRLTKALKTPIDSQVTRNMNNPHPKSHSEPTVVRGMPVIAEQYGPIHNAPPIKVVANETAHPQISPANKFVDSQLQRAGNEEAESPFKKAPLHRRIKSKVKANKLKSLAASSLSMLLIGGFLVYQNLPSITLVLANREAGISAKIPEGIPSNFSLSPNISKSPGQVTLSFDSRSDDRAFTLTQLKAEVTTDSLKEKVAEVSNDQYQTYEASGVTLFLSGSGQADWVKGGMRYNITGDTGFSPDQLAVIASSL